MFNRHRKLFAAFCALVAAGLLVAGCRGRCGHRDPERVRKHVTRKVSRALGRLDASEEQRTLVLQAKDRLFDAGVALRLKAKGSRLELLKQWEADSPDGPAVHALVDARLEEARAFAHKVVDEVLQIHAALTPEQRAQVSERVREHLEDED